MSNPLVSAYQFTAFSTCKICDTNGVLDSKLSGDQATRRQQMKEDCSLALLLFILSVLLQYCRPSMQSQKLCDLKTPLGCVHTNVHAGQCVVRC